MNRQTKARQRRRGFKSFEVEAVLAVVFLLAAVLFPVFSHRREVVRRSRCQSSLKQIGLAYSQYMRDYDERYPRARSGQAFARSDTWADALLPYLKTPQLFQCPKKGGQGIGYGYNGNVATTTAMKIYNSDSLVLNFEVTASNLAVCGNRKTAITAPDRHLEGSNVLFLDGHVEWHTLENISDSASDATTPTFKVRTKRLDD